MNAVCTVLLLLLLVLTAGLLVHVRGLSRRLDAATAAGAAPPATVPAPDDAAIRTAVAAALAEDREREVAEARAFWAEQEARSAEDAPLFDTPFSGADPVDGWPLYFPRPTGPQDAPESAEDFPHTAATERMDPEFADALRTALEELIAEGNGMRTGHPVQSGAGAPADLEVQAEPAPTAPDPRRHPSHPDFVPGQAPSREWTDSTLNRLSGDGTALTDVRPGPLGTLDVYAFADGTTLCVAPGDRESAERLIEAVRCGDEVRLLGGSRFSGSYSLTFATGEGTVYVLADRVVASL
ncbi:hypothetical protein [Peterkaempfera bronchialis]|uniref:Secreted protein n=1 Tax=Peterkaempfera bronchialis TaxID=2126346 RepID=A0A345SZP7_9ACTN|nr:hypothetical protein [Peterkaempfera bronchialis]AXI79202.1 hypothetical protein C7M71_019090 [Peterkaempfera bronchialis]